MPVAFIGIVITLLFLVLFKKVEPLGIERLFLAVELLLLLTGFFILPIDAFNKFNINVMFGVCTTTLLLATFFRLIGKRNFQ